LTLKTPPQISLSQSPRSSNAIALSVGRSSALQKFSGMSAFRLSTISSAAARFSSDAGASLVLATVSSLGKGCLMQKINR
jgi:hypothetical protein